MLASEVLLPEPVGPVTRNNPRGRWISRSQAAGKPELFHGEQLVGNLPKHHRHVAALLEDRDAEAGQVAKGEAKVGPAHGLQLLLAAVGGDALHQRLGVGRLEDLGLELDHVAIVPNHRGLPHRNVQVACALPHDRVQQLIDMNRLGVCRHASRPLFLLLPRA